MQKTKIIVKSKYQIDFINFLPLVVVRRTKPHISATYMFYLETMLF